MVKPLSKKLKLHGFNNLTKTLSFNIYDICYTQTDEQQHQYIEYIDEEYNAERLTNILTDVADIIKRNPLLLINPSDIRIFPFGSVHTAFTCARS